MGVLYLFSIRNIFNDKMDLQYSIELCWNLPQNKNSRWDCSYNKKNSNSKNHSVKIINNRCFSILSGC